jgi:uncharacterized tellurite resistance protein B-like protein
MLESIRRFFQKEVAEPPSQSPDALRVAACALLLEVAHADGEFTAEERVRIEDALGRHFGLDETLARELIALAEQERTRSIDHFQFTRLIRDHYDLGQKVLLAELMWGVILADGKIADHEGYLVRKIGSLLELPAAYLSDAKQRVRGEEPGT